MDRAAFIERLRRVEDEFDATETSARNACFQFSELESKHGIAPAFVCATCDEFSATLENLRQRMQQQVARAQELGRSFDWPDLARSADGLAKRLDSHQVVIDREIDASLEWIRAVRKRGEAEAAKANTGAIHERC